MLKYEFKSREKFESKVHLSHEASFDDVEGIVAQRTEATGDDTDDERLDW